MRIAIINNWPHNYGGGIESYTRELIKILQKLGYTIDEFSTLAIKKSFKVMEPIKDVHQKDISNGAFFYRKHAMRCVKQIVKNDTYDLIITNTIIPKIAYYSSKVIKVQHMDKNWYSFKSPNRWFDFLNSIFLGIGYFRNILKSKNVVYFNKYENNFQNPPFWYIPTPIQNDFPKSQSKNSGKNILWMARHEEPHKGLSNLSKIYKLSHYQDLFVVAGSGPNTNKIQIPKNKLVGSLMKKQVISHLKDAKVFIITSNFEGMPLTIGEALSQGVPVVMFDSFTSAYYYKDCKAVKIVSHKNFFDFNNQINNIMKMNKHEYKMLSKSGVLFAQQNLTFSNFKNKWQAVIEQKTQ